MTTDKTIGEDTNTTHQYRVSAGVETYIITAVDAYAAERIAKSNYIKAFGIAPQSVTARMVTPTIASLADLWKDEREDDAEPVAIDIDPCEAVRWLENKKAEALAVALENVNAAFKSYSIMFPAKYAYLVNDEIPAVLSAYRAKHPKDTR